MSATAACNAARHWGGGGMMTIFNGFLADLHTKN